MRIFLALWFFPVVLLGLWYGLSVNDMHFGWRILTRETHDLVFHIYGQMLGLDPQVLPGLVLKAIIFDSFIVLGIAALRWRRAIRAFFANRFAQAS